MKGKKIFSVKNILLGVVAIVCIAVLIVGNILAFGPFNGILQSFFGTFGAGGTFTRAQYFERGEGMDMDKAYDYAADVAERIEAGGAVLLKNENDALPLTQTSGKIKVSCFSQSSHDMIFGAASGSGAIDSRGIENLKDVLEGTGKVEVNPTLWNFYANLHNSGRYYRKSGGLAQGTSKDPFQWGINEVPQSEYTSDVRNSYAQYNDVAIVVIARTGCENGDLTRNMSTATGGANTASLLELDQNEKDMLKMVGDNFDKVIVLLNTGNAMECGFLDEVDYDIDACLWVGGAGRHGLVAVADILTGEVNPSGKLVDTYAYDVFSSPAMQNFGNFAYKFAGVESDHHYVAYAEGIYVGYKYYETRYEDQMLGRYNATSGEFDYDSQVQFPFGYGLSYTTFSWTDYNVTEQNDTITVSVKVTNTGSVSGKDVVEVYYQSPYNESSVVEKSAVELADFVKTKELASGESQTVSVTFDKRAMASYDTAGKMYSLDTGTYYITAASDAHEAVDNFLQEKGGTDNALTYSFNQTSPKPYRNDSYTGTRIDNHFKDAEGTGITYLSRKDWSKVNANGLRYADGMLTADNDGDVYYKDAPFAKKKLEVKASTRGRSAFKASGNPDAGDEEAFPEQTVGAKTDMKLIQLKGKSFDDPLWDALLNQITLSDLRRLVNEAGYKTQSLKSIVKPYASDIDGPSTWNAFIGSLGVMSPVFPYEVVVASTWDKPLCEEMGDAMGELCLQFKVKANESVPNLTGWYAPAMNIHRTPFGGRNYEYYSEDSTVSGMIGSAVVKGASERGVICYVKHFAFNEQEANRMTNNCVWGQEQALREIYLKPFEMTLKDNMTITVNGVEQPGSVALMTAYNRIGYTWTGGSYALLTELVRNEWGFKGAIVTDFLDGDWENVDQTLAAGGSVTLNPNAYRITKDKTNECIYYLKQSAKTYLYSFVNSNGMNGIDMDTSSDSVGGIPKFYFLMGGIDVVLTAGLVVSVVFILLDLGVIGKKKDEGSQTDDATSQNK